MCQLDCGNHFTIYIYKVIMLYTSNIYSFCQPYLKKVGEKLKQKFNHSNRKQWDLKAGKKILALVDFCLSFSSPPLPSNTYISQIKNRKNLLVAGQRSELKAPNCYPNTYSTCNTAFILLFGNTFCSGGPRDTDHQIKKWVSVLVRNWCSSICGVNDCSEGLTMLTTLTMS